MIELAQSPFPPVATKAIDRLANISRGKPGHRTPRRISSLQFSPAASQPLVVAYEIVLVPHSQRLSVAYVTAPFLSNGTTQHVGIARWEPGFSYIFAFSAFTVG